MSLLSLVKINSDESGSGFYRRVAQSNCFASVKEMTYAVGWAGGQKTLFSSPEAVSVQLGLDTACAKLASSHFRQATAFGSFYRRSTDAICPACIGESAYLRKNWDHGLVTACVMHKCRLIDSCPQCSSPLSKTRQRIDACECGFELKHSEHQAATKTELWSSSLVCSGTASVSGYLPVKKSVPPNTVTKLLRVLATGADATTPFMMRSTASGFTDLAQAQEFIERLAPIVSNWPEGFRKHVEDRIEFASPDARTINSLLGPWYQTLNKLSKDTAFGVLVEHVIEVVSGKTSCVVAARGSDIDGSATVLTTAAAAKQLGLGQDCLLKAIKDQKCSATGKKLGTRGVVYEIPVEEVARIQRTREEWISLPQACEVTGLSESVLRNLLASGVVQSDTNWRHDFFKAGPVHQGSLEKFTQKLCASVSSAEIEDGQTLSISQLTSRKIGDKLAIQTVFKALDTGEIRVCKSSHVLGAMEILATNVYPIFSTPLLETGMTVEQLSKETGWKFESITAWISAGHLGAETISRRGQSCRVILPSHILKFRAKYVVLADFAKSIDTKSSAYLKLISHAIPTVEVTNSQGVKRGLLIRTSDIAKFLVDACKPERNQRELFETPEVA